MTTAADVAAEHVEVTEQHLTVDLTDGRSVTVPLAWFPRLLHGSAVERTNWRLLGEGTPSSGLTWTSTSGSRGCWRAVAAGKAPKALPDGSRHGRR
jgi:hypothetical protein